jgi:hypothetical protein
MATIHWAAGVSGDWATKTRWSSRTVPGASDNAFIDATGSYALTIDSGEAARSLTLNDATATVIDDSILALGKTLTLGAGTFQLNSGGTIVGGTLNAVGGEFVWNGGTLSGVTYEGTLDLSAAAATLFITGGLTAKGVSGAGAGAIDLTGAGSSLRASGGETLDKATLDIGANGGSASLILSDVGDANPLLTLGGKFNIVQTGAHAGISSIGNADDCVVNDGSITAGIGGGFFVVNPRNFTNNGAITVSNSDILYCLPGALTNISGTTLTGGSYEVDANSTLELNSNVKIATDDATIILSGARSVIERSDGVLIDASLTTIGAAGTLELLGGRNWRSNVTMSNAGKLDLGGGFFAPAGLTNEGLVSGRGVVAVMTTDAGSIEAAGGILDFAKAITGGGTMAVDSGAILEADSSAASTLSVIFDGAHGTLALGSPLTFAATINGFAPTDTIDLLGITATSAVLGAGDTLVITNGTKAVATLQLAGSFTGDTFNVASNGKGGTTIGIATPGTAIDIPGERIPASHDSNVLPTTHQFIAAMATLRGSAAVAIQGGEAWAPHEPVLVKPKAVTA